MTDKPASPDLVQRHFTPEASNQLWCGDDVSPELSST